MTQATDLTSLSLTAAADMIRTRRVSTRELTRACLERIERLNPALNTFITVTADLALEQAARLDAEAHRGEWRGPLHGIPLALKDNIDTAGVLTTAASAAYADRVPAEDAEVVTRLKDAGAVLLGKLNMHEFAFGTTSVISRYGPVRNPWDRDRIAGGSSGGSAAAVAAGLCYGALGTDTGGSIRLPAACCGVVGLKPTYGLVSTRGVVPLSWTLDHVGPLCRTVADTALLLSGIVGLAPPEPPRAGVRIGLPSTLPPAPEGQGAMEAAVDVFRSLGADVYAVDLPETSGRAIFAEVYAFHADLLERAPGAYASETRARIEATARITAGEYITARRHLEHVRGAAGRLFSGVDVLLVPTTPGGIPRIDECLDPAALTTAFTAPFNVLGLPALSLPCGRTPDGLPLGLQIVGPPGGEAAVLAVASQYEQATPWHTLRPPLP